MENRLLANSYKLQLQKSEEIAFVPRGDSMWPFIKNKGQTVVIRKKTNRLNKFDVGFYESEDGFAVLHRVLEVLVDGYIFCGDSQFNPEFVAEDKVFGVMKGQYKKAKFIENTDKKLLKKVQKWYKCKFIRKVKVRLFYLLKKV